MRYKITHSKKVKEEIYRDVVQPDENNTLKFTPFSLTLSFESEDEVKHFHDVVAPLLAPGNTHVFYMALFKAGLMYLNPDVSDKCLKGHM